MKKPILFMLLMSAMISAANAQDENPHYDKKLADSLGADTYGMKSYVLVNLTTGNAEINDKAKQIVFSEAIWQTSGDLQQKDS